PIENTITTKSIYNLNHNIQWAVEDTDIAYYENGEIKTVSIGKTKLTAYDSSTGIELTCDITVKESYKDVTDGIITSVYGPGWDELLTSEQFSLIADAGIDLVYGRGGGSVQDNKNAIKYAYQNGMNYMVVDYNIYANSPHLSKEEIRALYEEYRGMSGFGGVYLTDEPKNPNKEFVRPYNILKEIEPELFVHLNFLPGFVYDSYEQYEFQLDDFAALTTNTDYLMFDIYPFLYSGGVEYKAMFDSYNTVRKSGLKNDIKTACYIQAVGYGGATAEHFAKRVPTAADILYQDMVSLAYGFKHLSYFKWGPGGSSPTEKFSDGGIDADGNPTPTYYAIQAANRQIHALGGTLANLDAEEVYLSGSSTYSQPTVPADFFVHTSSGSSLVFSYLKDRQTGRNFLMVVNNDVENAVTVPLSFADGINKISVADNQTGDFSEKNINGNYNVTLAAGDAALIALPEGYRYSGAQPEANRNIALNKRVTGTSSIGEDGWYLNCLTDGYVTDSANKGLNGWCSEKSESSYETSVTVDLGETKQFNSLTLYAAASQTGAREFFPKSYTVSVSDDNENWRNIITQTDAEVKSSSNFTFSAVNARYVKITVTDMNCVDQEYAAAIAEIEITAEPKVERVYTQSDSPDGYYVYAFCAGADYVKMPTWTQKAVDGNTQDDIIWYNAEPGIWEINGKEYNYRYFVPVSEHNGEHGMYNTHVYAYNAYGNHAIGTVFRFTNDYVFDLNYGNVTQNLITGLENVVSAQGVTVSCDSSEDTLTLNGTLQNSFTFLDFTALRAIVEKGDTIKATVEFISGSTDGYVVLDLYNDLHSSPLGSRMFRDFKKTGSHEFYIDSDELADEISVYKLWLYKPETYNPVFSNLKIRVKLEIINSDEYIYSPSGKSVEYASYVGNLPVLENRSDARFLGWFTQPEAGEQVTSQTFNTQVGSTVLYAHWQEARTEYVYSSEERMTAAQFASLYLDGAGAQFEGDSGGYMATGTAACIKDSSGIITDRYIFVLYGDLNSDGLRDGRDAVIFSSIECGMLNEGNTSFAVLAAADCNNDGETDENDYRFIIYSGLKRNDYS
ncbi:MAG: discoidin domain-containing protein, partial [Clostridia bacterium]|nr:discoidin domain-containing protein [Clostridia bacterium]